MADSAVVVTSGTGTNIDTRTEGTNGNHRQVVVIGDPATNAGVAPVDATAGLKVDLGADNDVTVTGTVDLGATDNAVLDAILADTTTIAGDTTSIDSKIPALGQALAAGSVPVVLTAAQITTLTPPAAITGFATSAKQDTQTTLLQGIAGFTVTGYDYIGATYPDTSTEVYTYKTGGSGGATITTITVVYSDAVTKQIITSVTKT